MTINQSLDSIFIKYYESPKVKRTEVPVVIEKLKNSLTKSKILLGGNTEIENTEAIKNIIRSGSAKPQDWI